MLTADRTILNAWWPALVTAIDAHETYCIAQVNTPTADPTAEALYVAAFETLGTSIVNWLQKNRDSAIAELYMGLYGIWSKNALIPSIASSITDSNYEPLKMFDPSGILSTIQAEADTPYYTTNTDTNYIDAYIASIDAQTATDDLAAVRSIISGFTNYNYFLISMSEDVITYGTPETKATLRDKFYGTGTGKLRYKDFIVASGRYATGTYAYPLDASSPLFGTF